MRRGAGPTSAARIERSLLQLSVYVRARDTAGGRPLYREIVERAQRAGLAGATAVRGLQGFGNSARLAPPGLLGWNGSEPVLIDLIDEEARVRAFLPVLDQLVGRGIVVLRPVVLVLGEQAGADAEQAEVG